MACIFCQIVKGEIPAEVVYRDEEMIAFRDIHPQAPVHILIIPTRHIETILEVTTAEEGLISRMILRANQLAQKEKLDEKGFRLVFNCKAAGGQEVYHLHLHLLGGRQMKWPPG